MTRVVAIISAYGLLTVLPIFIVFQPFFVADLPGIPVRYGDLLDLLLTPWVGVGVFAWLHVLIPTASGLPTGHKNLYRVLFRTFSVAARKNKLVQAAGFNLFRVRFSMLLATLGAWLLGFGSFVEPSTMFLQP